MFHRVHFVERWGKGISLILSKEPTADFKEVADLFITTFKRKGTEKAEEGLVEGLVETQKEILKLILQNQAISKQELSKRIGVSTTAIDKNIATLKEKGLLKRVGPPKGGHWEITER